MGLATLTSFHEFFVEKERKNSWEFVYILDKQYSFPFSLTIFFLFQTDDDPPQSFTQAFVLKPANDSFFIQHDMFRLVIHNA